MKKKNIPWVLATIRAITFIPIVLSTFNLLPLTVIQQLLGTAVIMGSDIFDGKISRKYNNEKDKLRFRIFDTTIDKTGIFSCIIGLLVAGKISIPYALVILGYNTILLSGGLINFITSDEKKEKTVQGLTISRLFTALTGLSIILLNNVSLGNILETLLTIGMGTLGVSSLILQLDDKIKQKKTIENKKITNNKPTIKEEENEEEKELIYVKDKVVELDKKVNKQKDVLEELKEIRELYTNSLVEEEKPKVFLKK